MKYCLPLVLIAFLAAEASMSQAQEKGSASLYPLAVGRKWHYRVVGEDQHVLVKVTKAEESKVTRGVGKEKKEETISKMTLETVSGGRTLSEQVAVLVDGVYRFAAANKEISPPLRFLKLPARVGESWQVDSVSKDVPMKGTFTVGEANVEVPAGKFKTITSTSRDFQIGSEKMSVEYYFAPGVGLVKQRVQGGKFDTTLELTKAE